MYVCSLICGRICEVIPILRNSFLKSYNTKYQLNQGHITGMRYGDGMRGFERRTNKKKSKFLLNFAGHARQKIKQNKMKNKH
jgi:hypothetical protein